MTDLTVLEFVTHHIETQPCKLPVKWHVDLLVKSALDHGHTLWDVVTDGDGRRSLIWLTTTEQAWQRYLDVAIEARALDELIERTFPG